MLLRLQRLAVTVSAVAVAAFFFSATWMLWRAPNLFLHMDGTLTRTEATLSKARATLDNLDKGTKVWADASKQEAGDVADTMMQVRGTLSGAQDAFAGITPLAQHLSGTADAASSLLASAQRTTDQMPTTLTAFNGAIGNLSDLAGTGNDSLNQFNALLARKSLTDAIDGLGATAQNAGKISADLHVWSHPILNPDPCVTAGCRWKKGLAVAGSFAGFGSNLYGAKNLFSPLSVKVQK